MQGGQGFPYFRRVDGRKLGQINGGNPAANAHKLNDNRVVIFSNRSGVPFDINITDD
jgi:hypothetical protein